MSVLLTGSTGFVGVNLNKYLTNKSFKLDQLNLRDENWKYNISIEGTTMIHLAGKAHDTKKSQNSNDYFEINTKLTKELFDFFLASDFRDFIYFSSIKAVTDKAEFIVTEETIPNPQTVYGQSKFRAEQYMLSKNIPKGKRIFIIRPSMIHGPGNKGNLNLLYHIVSKQIPWPLGAFNNKRSFCSIDNVCFVVNEILDNNNIPSGIYNLTDDRPISTNRLIELISISLDKKTIIYKIPRKIINILVKAGDFFRLPLNTERLEKLTENFVVSNEKIVKTIGKSLPVSVEDGLMKTFNSFKL